MLYKIYFFKLLIAVTFLQPLMVQSQIKKQQPNIIVFMVDDMGWMDSSVPFADSIYPLNKRYYTPYMAQLAKEGMKFTNAYSTPVCTPARISMLTGMNAAQHGVTNWTATQINSPTDNKDEQFEPPLWNHNGLSPDSNVLNTVHATPLPFLLKEVGYYTIHVGKAHWGASGTPAANPHNLGFMVSIAGTAAGHPGSYYGQSNYGNIAGKADWNAIPDLQEYYGKNIHLTEALTLEAIKSIQTPINRKQPFFLNLSHYAVHQPLVAHQKYFNKYLNQGLDSLEAAYSSLVEGMDKSLGDLVTYLKKMGVEKNTVILFVSDNGGLSNPKTRSGEPYIQNKPLRSGKGSLYEGGIRVPMIVKWPALVRPGTTTKQPIIIDDFFPTIIEMAGIKKTNTIQKIDGLSFLPILKNQQLQNNNRLFIWHFPHKWTRSDGPGINFHSALRYQNWKLLYNMRTKEKELYNLTNDIGEENNVATVYPAITKQLSDMLGKQLRKQKAKMPIEKSTEKTVPYPDEL